MRQTAVASFELKHMWQHLWPRGFLKGTYLEPSLLDFEFEGQ